MKIFLRNAVCACLLPLSSLTRPVELIPEDAMVRLALQVRATLERVERLAPSGAEHGWQVGVRCTACGEPADKTQRVSGEERTPLPHGRADTNLLIRCKMCTRENSLDVEPDSYGVYKGEDSGKFKTVVVFQCRGVEPYEFQPGPGWFVESEDNGNKFEDVDLTEKEWVEYDEKNNTSVGIYEFESQFIKIK